jgi:hypothetical protein
MLPKLLRPSAISAQFAFILGVFGAALPLSQAAETKVRLFDQDCQLSGPLSVAQLRGIHSIGPEQLPDPTRLDQASKHLERITTIKGLPAAFDEYRDRLAKRLKPQVKFFQLWNEARKKGSNDALLAHFKLELSDSRFSEVSKLLEVKEWRSNQDSTAEIYFATLEEYPQEVFFKSLTRLKIRYQCSFDEGEQSHQHDSAEN